MDDPFWASEVDAWIRKELSDKQTGKSNQKSPDEGRGSISHYTVTDHHVKEAGAAPPAAGGSLPDEIFLGVAGHLRGSPGEHEFLRNSPPISLPELVQALQERPVFFLCPRHPCEEELD